MAETKRCVEKYFKVAMAIGTSLKLDEMLDGALLAFIEKLDCLAVDVYEANQISKNLFEIEKISSKTAMGEENVFSFQNEIVQRFTSEKKKDFDKTLPAVMKEADGGVLHILPLGRLGYLSIVRKDAFNEEELEVITEIGEKLANACFACMSNQALQESEKKYKDLGELLPEMVCEVDLNGYVTFVNNYAFEKMGYEQADLDKGFHILKLFQPEEYDKVKQNFLLALQNTDIPPRDYIVCKKDGSTFPVIVYTNQLVKNGKVSGLRGVMIDISSRKANEHQLRQYAERLELALIGSDSGLWDWNIITGQVYFNDRWCSMLGYTRDEIEPNVSSWEHLVHPEDMDEVMKALTLHLEGKTELYQTEHRMRTKSGEWKWILDTGKVTERDAHGNPVRAVGTHINIQDQKTSDYALKKNLLQQELLSEIALELNKSVSFEKRINSVISKTGAHTQVSRVYVFEDSADGETTSNVFEWCNTGIIPQIEELQGIPYKMIPSWKKLLIANGYVHSENIKDLPEDLQVILEPQGIKSIIIYPLYVQDNFFGFIGFDECKRIKQWERSELELLRTISGIIANTYERKLSEESLKESEAKNRAILESIPDILMHIDKDGQVLSYRNASHENFGVEPDDVAGQNITKLFLPNVVAVIKNAITTCLEQGSYLFEYTMDVNKKPVAFEARMSKMNDNEVIAIVRNVSERKEYERKITKERDKANKANKAKSEFLANMSHEIRTPMNAILGFSEALYYKLEKPEHKKMVKSVLNSGNLLLSLLNDILDLSKIEAGKLDISFQPVDIRNILEELKLLFTKKAEEKGLSINMNIAEETPLLLMLDEIRIKQIIFNLVGNAIKFTHQGFVQINVDYIAEKNNRGKLQLDVIDSGIGITASEQEGIFNAFQQQYGQSNRKYGGAGLGLAISKRLVERMGGTILLESTEGEGSTFSVVISDVLEEQNVTDVTITYETEDNIIFDKATVLIVDDVQTNLETINSLLSDTNLSVMNAESGEIALEILNHTKPDLILLDIRMPGIDGYETAKRIKKQQNLTNIPIIAFTASVMSSSRIEKSSDFDGFLYKPVKRANLMNKLAGFLPHKVESSDVNNEDCNPLETDTISDKMKLNISVVKEEMNNRLLNHWNEVKNTLVLFNIEEFTESLLAFSDKYDFKQLKVYAQMLQNDIDDLNLESLDVNLAKFPQFVEYVNGKI